MTKIVAIPRPSFPGLLVTAAAAGACGGEDVRPVEILDITPPTLEISMNVVGAATALPMEVRFHLSEPVVGSFTEEDVVVAGGVLDRFEALGPVDFVGEVRPALNTAGLAVVSVPAEAFQDRAGNPNARGASSYRPFDTRGALLSDFETASPRLSGFDGVAAWLGEDPVAPENQVLTVSRPGGSGTTAHSGVVLELCSAAPFSADATHITLRSRSPRAGVPMLLKVERSDRPEVFVEVEARTGRADTWETLVFDLADGQTERSPRLDPVQSYDRLVLFPAFQEEPGVYGVENYRFDDIVLLGASAFEACSDRE